MRALRRLSPSRPGRLLAVVGFALAGGAGCGDVGALELDVTFPNEESELRTRALRVVVREGPPDGSVGCEALWGEPRPGLRQTEEVTAFPNRNDVLAAAVSLDYDALSIFVYGHPGISTEVEVDDETGEERVVFVAVGDPLVGGCVDTPIEDAGATRSLEVVLFPAP